MNTEKTLLQKTIAKENTHIMPVSKVIDKVTVICKANGVRMELLRRSSFKALLKCIIHCLYD